MEMGKTFERMEAAVCPVCGGEAGWGYLDGDMTRVELICVNCGRMEVPKARFDEAEADAALLRDPEEEY